MGMRMRKRERKEHRHTRRLSYNNKKYIYFLIPVIDCCWFLLSSHFIVKERKLRIMLGP